MDSWTDEPGFRKSRPSKPDADEDQDDGDDEE